MSFVLTKQPNFLPLFVVTAKACRAVAQGVGGGVKPRPRIPLALTRQCDTTGTETATGIPCKALKCHLLAFSYPAILYPNFTTKAIKGRRQKLLRPDLILSSVITEPSRRKNNFHKPKTKKTAKKENFFFFFLDCSTLVSFSIFFVVVAYLFGE